jgi:hypothetical protein
MKLKRPHNDISIESLSRFFKPIALKKIYTTYMTSVFVILVTHVVVLRAQHADIFQCWTNQHMGFF